MGVTKYDPAQVFAGYRFAAVAVADSGPEPPEPAEPVEIGVTILDGAVIGETRTWLIHPQRQISPWATRGHGITNDHVASAPGLDAVADRIRATLGDRIVLAHRGRHHRDLLAAALPGWAPPMVLDTRRMAARAWPIHSQALGALVEHTHLTVTGTPGRARHDAPATAMLFLAAATRLGAPAQRLFELANVIEAASR